MSLLQRIESSYGTECKESTIEFWRHSIRYEVFNIEKGLLTRCRRQDVLPQHLANINIACTFNNDTNGTKLNKLVYETRRKILNLEIEDRFMSLESLKKLITKKRQFLVERLNSNDLLSVLSTCKIKRKRTRYRTKLRLRKKFDIICERQTTVSERVLDFDHAKWIVNLSNVKLPPRVEKFLSLGPNFGIPYDSETFPVEDIICDIESRIENIETRHHNKLRSDITNIIKNSRFNFKQSREDKFILQLFNETRVFLKKQKENIFVTRADKGSVTVVMNRSDYVGKAMNMLADKDTYEECKKDQTITFQNKFLKLIKSWYKDKHIDEPMKKRLICETGTIPKFYALPKIHKKDIPLRPIISAVTSPSYNLSKYYHKVLSNVTGKKTSHIENSIDFINKIKNITIPDNYKLISFDVTSLFTNIPLDLVSEIIASKWDSIKEFTTLPKDEFLKGLELIFSYSQFSFQGKIFKQTFGTPMGAPLSPVLADLIMETLEEKQLANLDFNLPFFYRYVDDIVSCIPEDRIESTLTLLNSFHPRLQFTTELENNDRLSFLDVLIIRDNNVLHTNWYRKPTWSGRILNYRSHHSESQKIAMVFNLVDKALQLSHEKYHDENLTLVKSTLTNNLYPKKFIERYIKKRLNFYTNNTQKEKPDTENNVYVAIPFVNNADIKLKKTLKKYNVTPIFYNNRKNNVNFSKLKDRDPMPLRSSVVYEIPCKGCEKVYIGQTKQYLKQRHYQHDYNVKLNEKSYTALTKHRVKFDHNFDYEKTKVRHSERFYKKRLIREMINIVKTPNTVNERSDVENLSVTYIGIL